MIMFSYVITKATVKCKKNTRINALTYFLLEGSSVSLSLELPYISCKLFTLGCSSAGGGGGGGNAILANISLSKPVNIYIPLHLKQESDGLKDKVSASQPQDGGFEPHTCHDHDSSYDTSTGWFQEADSGVI